MEITLGNLIDQLTVCNLKIWHLEDKKRDTNAKDSEIAECTKKTNLLNSQRNCIIEAIDIACNKIADGEKQQLFGQGSTKMYGK